MASLVLSKMSANECVICADTYTDFKRKKIGCGFCQFECCIECIKTYLLTQTALPHCMSCKTQWDDADCDKKFGNFMHTKYRVHRKFMLFEGEKAKIPETMTAVENYLNVNKWQKEVKELDNTIEKLYLKLVNVRTTRNIFSRSMSRMTRKRFSRSMSRMTRKRVSRSLSRIARRRVSISMSRLTTSTR